MFSDIKVIKNEKAGTRGIHSSYTPPGSLNQLRSIVWRGWGAEANNTKPLRVKEQSISSEV